MSNGTRISGDSSRSRTTVPSDEPGHEIEPENPDRWPLPGSVPAPDKGLGTFRIGGDFEVMGEQEVAEA